MIFRELLEGGFGILMFQNCQVCENLPLGAFPIYSIIQHKARAFLLHPYKQSNFEQINKQQSDTP